MRIAIIGPGAIGSYFAGILAQHQEDVCLLARVGKRYDQVAANGIGITGARGSIHARPPIYLDAKEAGDVDIVLVTVKSFDTAKAIAQHKGIVGPDTVVVSIQNGIGNIEALEKTVGNGNVLAASTIVGAHLDSDGLLHLAGEGGTQIGHPAGGHPDSVRMVASTLSNAGLMVTPVSDIMNALYIKLAINCAINPITALTSLTNGELDMREPLRDVARVVVEEVARVASAEGNDLDAEQLFTRTMEVSASTARNRSSMLGDVENGRHTEVEAINGAVSALGKKHNIPTPVNDVLANLIRGMGYGVLGSF